MVILMLVVGLVVLTVGGELLVRGSSRLAMAMGISPLVVGLTVVAAGTSMPEVATSIMAAIRGERDIAVGNVVGSNIFNILSVLGTASAVSADGVRVSAAALQLDIPVMIAVAVACLPAFLPSCLPAFLSSCLLCLLCLLCRTCHLPLERCDVLCVLLCLYGVVRDRGDAARFPSHVFFRDAGNCRSADCRNAADRGRSLNSTAKNFEIPGPARGGVFCFSLTRPGFCFCSLPDGRCRMKLMTLVVDCPTRPAVSLDSDYRAYLRCCDGPPADAAVSYRR